VLAKGKDTPAALSMTCRAFAAAEDRHCHRHASACPGTVRRAGRTAGQAGRAGNRRHNLGQHRVTVCHAQVTERACAGRGIDLLLLPDQ